MLKRTVVLLTLTAGLVVTGVAFAAGMGTTVVTIKDMKYSPASVKIKVGETVVWTNADDRDHTVVAADGSFNSGNIGSGQNFSHSFPEPGTYAYNCSIHPRMRGSVVVSE